MTDPAQSLQPPAEVDPLIGRSLDDRYIIEKVLGEGGMGLVYKARHTVLSKPLAVKVLKPEVSRNEEVMARFRREAQAASAIGSLHICDVSDFGTLPDGSTYFVMEMLNGPPLSDVIEAESPIPTDKLLRVSMQLCDALGAAHAVGIVHRDLKPENVHLVVQGQQQDFVKILDFGIAKVADGGDSKLTQAGSVFGTPHYMSPEQCGGKEVDHRADIYALGVIMYEMSCGLVPFDSENLMGLLTKHVYEKPIPPAHRGRPTNLTPDFEAVIMRCLEKDVNTRYGSMAELRADLERVERGQPPLPGPNTSAVRPKNTAQLDPTGPHQVNPNRSYSSASNPSGIMQPYLQQPPIAPPPGSSTGKRLMVMGAIFGILMVAMAAFGLAFYFATPHAETTEEVVVAPDPEPVETNEPVETPDPPPEVVEAPPPVESGNARSDTIQLITEPASAEVYTTDSVFIGNTPTALARPEGSNYVTYRIRMAGHQDRSISISRITGSEMHLTLERTRRNGPRDNPRDIPRDNPRDSPRDNPRDNPRGHPMASTMAATPPPPTVMTLGPAVMSTTSMTDFGTVGPTDGLMGFDE